MGWVGRLFDKRDSPARYLLLCLTGVCYLVFRAHGENDPAQVTWGLAAASFATLLLLRRWQVLNLLVQAGLMAVALVLLDDATINQVAASWMLLETAMWASRGRTTGLATALLAAIYLISEADDAPQPIPQMLFGLATVLGVPVLLGLVIRTNRELGRQMAERVESDNQAARSAERGAIARELHDVVAHHVASMVLRIGVARHVLPQVDPRVGEVFDDVHSTGTTALADLRRLVEVLRRPDGVHGDAALTAIDQGALPAALSAAVDTATRAGVRVDAEFAPGVGGLDAVRGLAVLRLTQEALTNVAKHAGPSARACLRVAVQDGDLLWEVTDDGGTGRRDPAGVPPGGGHGIVGMRERVEVLGGELEVGPYGSGWRVSTRLPVPAGEEVG